eukprot:scaffold1677_cov122-Cylindrotheca_fusiformis.AAC.5
MLLLDQLSNVVPNKLNSISLPSWQSFRRRRRRRRRKSNSTIDKNTALDLSLKRFQACRDREIPRWKDIDIGKKLGEGSFGIIHDVIDCGSSTFSSSGSSTASSVSSCTSTSTTSTTGRYAVKRLRPFGEDQPNNKHSRKRQLQAIVDFETEQRILSYVKHPNIVQIYGIVVDNDEEVNEEGEDDASLFSTSSSTMMVMDRLHETLDKHLLRCRGTYLLLLAGSWNGSIVLEEQDVQISCKRLQIALDVASALDYLHSKCIMHRDVKPSNIAFDMVRDTLFFRLREVPCRDLTNHFCFRFPYD